MPLYKSLFNVKNVKTFAYERFLISDLIEKLANGNEKSIDRKLEDKYDLNGIGGMKSNPKQVFQNLYYQRWRWWRRENLLL